MGILDFSCITSTPDGSTIYGLDITTGIDESLGAFNTGLSVVIFKSDSSPKLLSPDALTWSVWSRVFLDDLKVVNSPYSLSCAVTNQGVFTFVFRKDIMSSEPSGFRFDPNGTTTAGKKDAKLTVPGNDGRGTWMSVNIATRYKWGSHSYNHFLEYVNAPSGDEPPQLVHAFFDMYGVYFSTYNDTTNTLSTAGSWAIGSANFGNIRMFLIAHSRLYLFSENAELYSYPLAFPLTPSLPANMTFTTTSQACKNAAPQSWHLFFSQKTLYLLCDERLYTIRNAPTNTIPEPEEMIGYDMYTGVFNIRAMGGSSSSIEIRSPEFLVFTKQQVPYTLKLDGQARTFTNLGSIKVLDSSGHLEREDQNSADVAVTVVSIVVLVLIGALVARCYNRIRREKKSAQDAIQAETGLNATGDVNNKPTPTSGPSNSQAIVPPVELSLNQAAQPVQFQPPTTILPMAPITSTPQQQQAVQNQMQELGFSSHPRPTVASVATGEPWKPTPFVPPASSQRIRSPEQDSSAPTEPILLSPPIPRTSRPRPEVDTQPTRPAVQHPHT